MVGGLRLHGAWGRIAEDVQSMGLRDKQMNFCSDSKSSATSPICNGPHTQSQASNPSPLKLSHD